MTLRLIALLFIAAPILAQEKPISAEAKQSAEEEREQVDAQVDEDKLPIDISVLLAGRPFPEPYEYENPTPEPRRRIRIAPGDDVNQALAKLEPGDQLVLEPGAYEGSFTIGDACRNGTAAAPIQIFARGAVLRPREGARAVLRVDRAHWSITGIQIVLADSEATAVVIGKDARDVILDGAHLYNGLGTGVQIEPGAARITIASSHIHHFGRAPRAAPSGIAIAAGASEISILGTHLHHNRGASIGVVPAGDALATSIAIRGNKIHDDKASAISLASASQVRIADNKIYNYRPVGVTGGEAISLGPGATNVAIETNHFAEASVAVDVAGAKRVEIRRNYLENRLTGDSTAFNVRSGSAVAVANNVIDRYRTVLRSAAAGEVAFSNNAIIEPGSAVFDAPEAKLAANVIGWNGESLPGAKAVRGIDLKDRDLAKLGTPGDVGITSR